MCVSCSLHRGHLVWGFEAKDVWKGGTKGRYARGARSSRCRDKTKSHHAWCRAPWAFGRGRDENLSEAQGCLGGGEGRMATVIRREKGRSCRCSGSPSAGPPIAPQTPSSPPSHLPFPAPVQPLTPESPPYPYLGIQLTSSTAASTSGTTCRACLCATPTSPRRSPTMPSSPACFSPTRRTMAGTRVPT